MYISINMSSYPYIFSNIVCGKVSACDAYVRNNINWVSHFQGISTVPLTVYSDIPLTEPQLAALTILMNAYVDPAVFLVFDHVDTFPLHSEFTNDTENSISNGNVVLQTFIFSSNNIANNVVLDSLKTVVEYKCPNVQNFLNITSGNSLQTNISIKDITRNVLIASQNINIDDRNHSYTINCFFSKSADRYLRKKKSNSVNHCQQRTYLSKRRERKSDCSINYC